MKPEEKKALEKKAGFAGMSDFRGVGGALFGLSAGSTGYEKAKQTRVALNRAKMRGGVIPQASSTPTYPDNEVLVPKTASAGSGASPRSELLDRLEKKAAWGSAVGQGLHQAAVALPVALLTGAGLALSSEIIRGGMSATGDLVSNIKRKQTLSRLMDRNPEFRRDKDTKERAERYFNLIMTYAPSLAKDDTAITDFMRRQLMYPTSSIEFLKQLADLESTIRGKVDPMSFGGRVGGAAADASKSIMSSAVADSLKTNK